MCRGHRLEPLLLAGLLATTCATSRPSAPSVAGGASADEADGAARPDAPSAPDYPRVETVIDVDGWPRWQQEVERTGARVVGHGCSEGTTLHTMTLWGPDEAIGRATALPFVKRVLAPGERPDLQAPAWREKISGVRGISCLDGPPPPGARSSFFVKIAGDLDPEKRAKLVALGLDNTMGVKSPYDGNTIIAAHAPATSVIPLAQLDFVIRIEGAVMLAPEAKGAPR